MVLSQIKQRVLHDGECVEKREAAVHVGEENGNERGAGDLAVCVG